MSLWLDDFMQRFHLPDPGIESSALLPNDRQADLNRSK